MEQSKLNLHVSQIKFWEYLKPARIFDDESHVSDWFFLTIFIEDFVFDLGCVSVDKDLFGCSCWSVGGGAGTVLVSLEECGGLGGEVAGGIFWISGSDWSSDK